MILEAFELWFILRVNPFEGFIWGERGVKAGAERMKEVGKVSTGNIGGREEV
jgi:hypothetical protein